MDLSSSVYIPTNHNTKLNKKRTEKVERKRKASHFHPLFRICLGYTKPDNLNINN